MKPADLLTATGPWSPRRWQSALILLVTATFALRARYFGDPFVGVDEEFYLLVGDRMLHGTLPYVDLWDRKPVGLFLLYAAIRLLGGAGIVQYQLVASGFAAATAVMIAVVARRISTPGASLVAACAYVPALAMNGGQGGQTPVFYNLPMIVAVWLVLGLAAPAADAPSRRAHVLRGAAAMLLVGLAMQIKYTALFEGSFLGLVLLGAGRANGMSALRLAQVGTFWAGLALLPTAAAWAAYAVAGHGPDFVYANFISILRRGAGTVGHAGRDLVHDAFRTLPFLLAIPLGDGLLRREAPWRASAAARAAHRVLIGWLAAAAGGFLVFGGYFSHYVLPLLPPLAVASAPLYAVKRRHYGVIAATATLATLVGLYPINAARLERRRGDAAYADRMVAEIAPRLGGRCLFVFYGEPILYHLTGSCLPTRWAFPFHLSLAREAPALGVDVLQEIRRILAARPPVIVDRLTRDEDVNPAAQALVRSELHRDYVLVFSRTPAFGDGGDADQIWQLRAGAGASGKHHASDDPQSQPKLLHHILKTWTRQAEVGVRSFMSRLAVSHCARTGCLVFYCTTRERSRMRPPAAMSSMRTFTTSHPHRLLSMARSRSARSLSPRC